MVIKLSKNKSFECFPKKRLTKKSIQINLRKSKQRNIRKYTNLISTVQSPKSKPNKTIFEIISSGEELYKNFQKLKKLPENERVLNLSKLIQPKVFLADQSIDKITGNKLSDIWTYLRLYWTDNTI